MNYKKLIWMAGAPALVVTVGIISHPTALLAQVKSALVRSVDEPGREPYMETKAYIPGQTSSPGCQAPALAGGGPLGPVIDYCQIFFSPVPAGKRLIIKNISSRISLTAQFPTGFSAEGSVGSSATIGSSGLQAGNFFLQPHAVVTLIPGIIANNYTSILQSHTEVQAYADPGTNPVFVINVLNALGSGNSYVTLSGYYVDIP